jgi:hypothetical protein
MCVIVKGLVPNQFPLTKGLLATADWTPIRLGSIILSMPFGEVGRIIDEHLFERTAMFQTSTSRSDIEISINNAFPVKVHPGNHRHTFTKTDVIAFFVEGKPALDYKPSENLKNPYSLPGDFGFEWTKEGTRRNLDEFEILHPASIR